MAIEDFFSHFGLEQPQTDELNSPMNAADDSWLPNTSNFKTAALQWTDSLKVPENSAQEAIQLGLNKKEEAVEQPVAGLPAEEEVPDLQKDNGQMVQKPGYKSSSSYMSGLKSNLSRALDSGEATPASVAATPAPSAPKTNPLDDMQAKLAEAQADRKQNLNASTLRGSATDFANAFMAGIGNKERFTPGFADQRLNEQADQKIKELKEGLQLPVEVGASEKAKIDLNNITAMNDRNSAESQAYIATAKLLFKDHPELASTIDGMSGTQVKNFVGESAANIIQKQTEEALKKEQMGLAHEDRMAANEVRRQNNADRAMAQKEKAELKATDTQNKAYVHTLDQLETMRGNPAVQQAERNILAAKNIQSLLDLYPDANKMPPDLVKTLNQEVQKMAVGGVPSQHDLEGMNDSYVKDFAAFAGKVLNSPQPANGGEFVKQWGPYVKHIEKNSQDIVKDRYGRVIEPRKSLLNEDQYKNVQDKYVNRFTSSEKPTLTKPESSEAANSSAPQTVQRKTKDGQVWEFDATTKQPLRRIQ